ncbi:MAG TPA: hypothetical protein VFV50_03485, partial [Bdellovibrionales bacterium]|nr:hypothetical protein [Bdellovibrionales bacterium]
LDSLHDAENATSQFTERIYKEVFARFEAGIGLLAVIIRDSSIPEEKKFEYVKKLAITLGNIAMGSYNGDMSKAEVEMARRMNGKPFSGNVKEYVKLAFVTMGNNLRDIFVPGGGAVAGRYWRPLEAVRRDAVTPKIAWEMERLVGEIVSKMDNSNNTGEAILKYWSDKVAANALAIQRYKRQGEIGAAIASVGIGLAGLAFPVVDLWSFANARGDNTLFFSSLVYFTAWTSFGAVQGLTVMNKATIALEKLLAILKNPASYVPRPRPVPFYDRVMKFVPNLNLRNLRRRGGGGAGRCGGAAAPAAA